MLTPHASGPRRHGTPRRGSSHPTPVPRGRARIAPDGGTNMRGTTFAAALATGGLLAGAVPARAGDTIRLDLAGSTATHQLLDEGSGADDIQVARGGFHGGHSGGHGGFHGGHSGGHGGVFGGPPLRPPGLSLGPPGVFRRPRGLFRGPPFRPPRLFRRARRRRLR